jgi:hypothetical protein
VVAGIESVGQAFNMRRLRPFGRNAYPRSAAGTALSAADHSACCFDPESPDPLAASIRNHPRRVLDRHYDRRARPTTSAFAAQGALHQLSDWQICTVSLRQRRQVRLGAVKSLLIETIDPWPMRILAPMVPTRGGWAAIRIVAPRIDLSCLCLSLGLIALHPDPSPSAAHAAFEAPPKCCQLAVVANRSR